MKHRILPMLARLERFTRCNYDELSRIARPSQAGRLPKTRALPARHRGAGAPGASGVPRRRSNPSDPACRGEMKHDECFHGEADRLGARQSPPVRTGLGAVRRAGLHHDDAGHGGCHSSGRCSSRTISWRRLRVGRRRRLCTDRLELIPALVRALRAALSGMDSFARALGVAVPDDWPPELLDDTALELTCAKFVPNSASQRPEDRGSIASVP